MCLALHWFARWVDSSVTRDTSASSQRCLRSSGWRRKPNWWLSVAATMSGSFAVWSARLNVEGAVRFVSFDSTQRGGLGALLRSSDVVALLSDYEANPVAVMEALALGRKVVVADTSGLSELASEGLATAVPTDMDPHELAVVLAGVAASPEKVGPELPTWDNCAEELLLLYDEIASSRS